MGKAKGNCRVLVRIDETVYRLTRIWFGSDGSYYVGAPIPTPGEARLLKMTVDYTKEEMNIPLSELVDLAEAKNSDKEIKFSHHPDGFAQFSGRNITSGKDADGSIRGMGIETWPLWRPNKGPAFGLSMGRPSNLLTPVTHKSGDVLFDLDAVATMPAWDQLVLEGYYFPALWRRFIRWDNGEPYILLHHPCGAILRLRVLLAQESAELPGFIGLECYTQYVERLPGVHEDEGEPWFALSGPTGNRRTSKENHAIGDGLYCVYPADRMPRGRSVDYVPDYLMTEVPTDGIDHSPVAPVE